MHPRPRIDSAFSAPCLSKKVGPVLNCRGYSGQWDRPFGRHGNQQMGTLGRISFLSFSLILGNNNLVDKNWRNLFVKTKVKVIFNIKIS